MNERWMTSIAIACAVAFAAMAVTNYATLYGWILFGYWSLYFGPALVIGEFVLHTVLPRRPASTLAVSAALWGAAASWFVLEFAAAVVASLLLVRVVPLGKPTRVAAALGSVVVITVVALGVDIDPWSSDPEPRAFTIAFYASTVVVIALLLLLASCRPVMCAGGTADAPSPTTTRTSRVPKRL